MPLAAPALPATIDGVVERLETIVEDCARRRDRAGYFAALYNRVTLAVREGIRRGDFDDGARMERLDVTFACRYLRAYDQYCAGELPSRVWLQAFCATGDPDPIVLQHLLVGMNAHINLDLGVAAARTCPGAELAPLRADFDRINAVLATLTPVVEQEIDGLSPLFGALTSLAPRLELKMIGFSMEKARAAAWDLAVRLAPLAPAAQVEAMGRRDVEATLVGTVVLNEGLLVRAIGALESRDVERNIRALAQGEFRVRAASAIGL